MMIKRWSACLFTATLVVGSVIFAFTTLTEEKKPQPVEIYSELDKNVTDTSLLQLTDIQNLEKLRIPGSLVTNAGLKNLRPHTSLKEIDLSLTQVTDDGLDELLQLPNLETVSLFGANITDNGVEKLVRLPKLKSLKIGYTKVTDACFNHLTVGDIEELSICGTAVTDDGLVKVGQLGGLQRLKKLDLHDCKVSDRGVAALKALPELASLQLNGKITDAAVTDLAAIKKLTYLNVEPSRMVHDDFQRSTITALGIARLRALRPGLRIICAR